MIQGDATMKKILGFVLCLCLVLGMLPTSLAANSPAAGDIDGNGVLDQNDVRALSDAILSGKLPAKGVADVTQDGVIGIDDLQALSQYIAGSSRTARIMPENGFVGPLYIGITARLEVYEHFMPFLIRSGTARVINEELSYDSGDIPLSFETSGRSLYCHLDTSNLTPSDNYYIQFSLFDRDGNIVPSNMPAQQVSVVKQPVFNNMILAESCDTEIVSPTLSMGFNRLYKHDALQANHLGDLGFGWSHSFDIYVLEYTDGLAGVHMATGASRWFQASGTGTYLSVGADSGKLYRDADGKYRLVEQDGMIYGFYKDGSLQFIMSSNQETIYLHRNSKNQIINAISSQTNRSLFFQYADNGRLLSIRDQYGRTTTYTYDESGTLLTEVTAADGSVTRYTYVPSGNERTEHRLSCIETPGGVFTHYFYDDVGRVSLITGTWGANPVQYVYDDTTGAVTIIDAIGTVKEVCYGSEPDTLLLTMNGQTTSYRYGIAEHLYTLELDEYGRLTAVSDGMGNTAQFVWDNNAGKISQVTDALGRSTTVEYDSKGNPIRFNAPDGSTVDVKYNKNGQMTDYTDAMGGQTHFTYTAEGQLASVSSPDNRTVSLSYDKYGSISTIKDPANKAYSYQRDILGKVTSVTYPDGTKETYNYRADGYLENKTDAAGNTIDYIYDSAGRLETCMYSDGASIHYRYDPRGALVAVSRIDAEGNVLVENRFTYDAIGRVTTSSIARESASSFDVSVYDENHNRIGYGYSDGLGITYNYDQSGRMTGIYFGEEPLAEYEYDACGLVTVRRLGNGTYTVYERDGQNRTVAIREYDLNDVLRDEAVYEYDANGNCLREQTPWGDTIFEYDRSDRLISAAYRDGSVETFQYDYSGNIISQTRGDENVKREISVANQVLTAGSHALKWDACGNLLSDTENGNTTLYTWNAEGRLTSVNKNGVEVKYTYDALGRLLSRITPESVVYYEWDNLTGALTSVTDETGKVLLRYVYGPGQKEAVAVLWDTGRAYFRQDRMHSIVGATDVQGNYTDRQLYSAYGTLLYGENLCDFGYAGMKTDSLTGLIYMGERWYDTELGIFLSPDKNSRWDGLLRMPVEPQIGTSHRTVNLFDFTGNNSMINRYNYAGCNPTKYWDTNGRDYTSIEVTAGGYSVGVSFNGDSAAVSIGFGAGEGISVSQMSGQPSGGFYISGNAAFGTGGAAVNISGNGVNTGVAVGASASVSAGYSFMLFGGGGGGYGGGYGGGGGGGCCPTFIQLDGPYTVPSDIVMNADGLELAASITVPVDGAYVRSDVPVFGVAGGTAFDHYTVEYGAGPDPEEWIEIETSYIPQNRTDVTASAIEAMQGDIDIRGNLTTWNTGLKNWEHLPWHPIDEDIDILGDYSIRLTVYAADGRFVQDSVFVTVGDVAAQCVGGTVHSTDDLFEMELKPMTLMSPFRVFSARPCTDIPAPEGALSPLYNVSPYGETFMQDVVVRFVTNETNCRVALYDADTREMRVLETIKTSDGAEARIDKLPSEGTYFVLVRDGTPAAEAWVEAETVNAPLSDGVFVQMTFDDDCGGFTPVDGIAGANVSHREGFLVLENTTYGGTFGVSCVKGPIDVNEYPVLSFDYCVLPGVRLDFYLLVNGRYYNINFTDDPQGFKNEDVNIASAGRVYGVIADGSWHTASVRLDKALAQATSNTVISEIFLRDLNVEGYMKLGSGSNAAGAALYLDNFTISADPESADSELLIDTFARGDVNLLGGNTGVFYGGSAACEMAAGDGSLRLKWSIGDDGYAGYWSDLNGLSLHGTDSLKICFAEESSDEFRVGIRCGETEKSVLAADFAEISESGEYSIVVPLTDLGFDGEDRADVVFITALGTEGEIEITRISLTGSARVYPERLSVFDQRGWSSFSDGAAAISYGVRESDAADRTDTLLRISYGGTIGKSFGGRVFSYAGWEQQMAPADVRNYDSLVIRICGEAGGEKPNIYLDDGTTRKCVLAKDLPDIETEYTTIRIALSAFADKGVDLSHVQAVQLVFEWEEMSGTVYVGDIAFE